MPYLFIDSDGSPGSTTVLVCGDDGACLGELQGVQRIDWSVEKRKNSAVRVTVAKVPGRFLANEILIEQLRLKEDRGVTTRWLGRSLRRVLRRGSSDS